MKYSPSINQHTANSATSTKPCLLVSGGGSEDTHISKQDLRKLVKFTRRKAGYKKEENSIWLCLNNPCILWTFTENLIFILYFCVKPTNRTPKNFTSVEVRSHIYKTIYRPRCLSHKTHWYCSGRVSSFLWCPGDPLECLQGPACPCTPPRTSPSPSQGWATSSGWGWPSRRGLGEKHSLRIRLFSKYSPSIVIPFTLLSSTSSLKSL